jgi:hypothetical protein
MSFLMNLLNNEDRNSSSKNNKVIFEDHLNKVDKNMQKWK